MEKTKQNNTGDSGSDGGSVGQPVKAVQRIGSRDGAEIPAQLHAMESCRTIGSLKNGDYGWTTVMADVNNRAFAYQHSAVYENQGEFSPHFIQKTESGYKARLMSQGKVLRVDGDLSFANNASAIQEVEF
jgi:hypothetical protein